MADRKELKKLSVIVKGCNCNLCGPAKTWTFEQEAYVNPDGAYKIKFYEVEWETEAEDDEGNMPDADHITADGHPVYQLECREIKRDEYRRGVGCHAN